MYSCRLLCLSKGGNDGVMINMGLVWRSKSLSPAKINLRVSRDDGRHTSQLIEHAKGHWFFLCVCKQRSACLLSRAHKQWGIFLFKAASVYVTTGKSLDWIINIYDKRVLNSLYSYNIYGKCLKAGLIDECAKSQFPRNISSAWLRWCPPPSTTTHHRQCNTWRTAVREWRARRP